MWWTIIRGGNQSDECRLQCNIQNKNSYGESLYNVIPTVPEPEDRPQMLGDHFKQSSNLLSCTRRLRGYCGLCQSAGCKLLATLLIHYTVYCQCLIVKLDYCYSGKPNITKTSCCKRWDKLVGMRLWQWLLLSLGPWFHHLR